MHGYPQISRSKLLVLPPRASSRGNETLRRCDRVCYPSLPLSRRPLLLLPSRFPSCYRATPRASHRSRSGDQAITLWLRDEQDPVVSPRVTKLLLSQSVGRDLLPHLPNHGAYLSIIRRDLPELFSLILSPPSHHGLILAVLAHFLGKIRVERYLTSHYYRDNVTQWLEELISR